MKPFLLLAAVAGAAMFLPATPAAAQKDWIVKDIFGNEPCPSSQGEEIVVCRRLPAEEKYRIPKDLRDAAKDAGPPGWSERVKSLEYVGSSGTNSCTPEGAGGWTGCWSKLMHEAHDERKATKKAEATLP